MWLQSQPLGPTVPIIYPDIPEGQYQLYCIQCVSADLKKQLPKKRLHGGRMLDRLQIKTLFMHQLHREMSIYIHQIGLITNGGWRRRGGSGGRGVGGGFYITPIYNLLSRSVSQSQGKIKANTGSCSVGPNTGSFSTESLTHGLCNWTCCLFKANVFRLQQRFSKPLFLSLFVSVQLEKKNIYILKWTYIQYIYMQ